MTMTADEIMKEIDGFTLPPDFEEARKRMAWSSRKAKLAYNKLIAMKSEQPDVWESQREVFELGTVALSCEDMYEKDLELAAANLNHEPAGAELLAQV